MVLKGWFGGKSGIGKKLGELLSTNSDIQKIAAKYGFRTNDPVIFAAEAKSMDLDAPEQLNLADAPSTTILDAMNQTIIKKLEGN